MPSSAREKFVASWAIIATLIAIWKLLRVRVLGHERDCPPLKLKADGPQFPERPPGQHYHPQLHQLLDAQHRLKEERIRYKATGVKPISRRSKTRNTFSQVPAKDSAISLDLDYARKYHRATTALPARSDTFHTPNVYSGLDVRKASFQSHLATGRRRPKKFSNVIFPIDHPTHPSEHPVPYLFDTATRTSDATREFPVASGGSGYLVDNQMGEARILLSAGPHFEAVIAHNRTLPVESPEWDDHYLAAHRRISLHEHYTAQTFIC